MEAYMGCMLEECVVRACYLRKHGNREGVNKWLIDRWIDTRENQDIDLKEKFVFWSFATFSSVALMKRKATKKWPGILKSIIVYWLLFSDKLN